MKIGIIAEGPADVAIIKAILNKLKGVDQSDILVIRPEEQVDETELAEKNFSNWTLVLKESQSPETMSNFFELLDDERFLVIQIDTAERGEKGYDVSLPLRTSIRNWEEYSEALRESVIIKIEQNIEKKYQARILYAICIEETDAWLIPLWDKQIKDSAQKVKPKEYLGGLVAKLKPKEKSKLVDSNKHNLNYVELGVLLKKNLAACRKGNQSLNAFCESVESKIFFK